MFETDFDLCVVGGGITGVLTALRASEINPKLRVCLLDAKMAGQGAVFVSSAMLLGFAFDEAIRDMTAKSALFYESLRQSRSDIFEEFEFFWGSRRTDTDPSGSCIAPLTLEPGWPKGIPARLEAPTSITFYRGRGLRARAHRLHSALIERLLSFPKALLVEGCPVADVHPIKGKLSLETPLGAIRARKVIATVGPWVMSAPFASSAVSAGVRVKKVVSLHIPFTRMSTPAAGVGFLEDEVYIAPDASRKHWIVSITSQDWGVSPDDGSISLSAQDLSIYERSMLNVGLNPVRPIGASVFADAYSSNAKPLLEQPRGFKGNLVICTGTSGYGVKVGPALAEEALSRIGLVS